MYATDPTLYGATFPYRDFSFMNPYFTQWQTPQIPWNFVPPMMQNEFLPPVKPFYNEFLPQMKPFYNEFLPPVKPFYGKYFMQPYTQLPYTQLPYQFKWQIPFVH